MSTWTAAHRALKSKVLKNPKFFAALLDRILKRCEKMNIWSEQYVFFKDLTKYSNQKLAQLLSRFIDEMSEVHALGVAVPILDFGNFKFIEDNLSQILRRYVKDKEYAGYFALFTQPTKDSFSLEQEKSLLKITNKFIGDKQWRHEVMNCSYGTMKKSFPLFSQALRRHTMRYAWVYYVYSGPAYTEEDYLKLIRDYLERKIQPAEVFRGYASQRKETIRKQKTFLRRHRIRGFERSILILASEMVWSKPRRKDLESKSYYHIEKLQKEIGRRLYLSLQQVRFMPPKLLCELLKINKDIDGRLAAILYERHICVPRDNGSVEVLYGDKSVAFSKKIYREVISTSKRSKKVLGTSACAGTAKGTVRIINLAEDMGKMKIGDILVSIATTPSVVPAMKKAAAIVTDEGGLTCHASIVSRELNIPCVVGTKISSQVFKDGDLVEVDASKGIVRKI